MPAACLSSRLAEAKSPEVESSLALPYLPSAKEETVITSSYMIASDLNAFPSFSIPDVQSNTRRSSRRAASGWNLQLSIMRWINGMYV